MLGSKINFVEIWPRKISKKSSDFEYNLKKVIKIDLP